MLFISDINNARMSLSFPYLIGLQECQLFVPEFLEHPTFRGYFCQAGEVRCIL